MSYLSNPSYIHVWMRTNVFLLKNRADFECLVGRTFDLLGREEALIPLCFQPKDTPDIKPVPSPRACLASEVTAPALVMLSVQSRD